MSDTKVCLDLFSGLGGFSAAFEEADGWEVVTVDIKERFDPTIQADVLDLRPSDLPDADVVLASPPCTEFSMAQNLNGDHTPGGDAIALVYHTLGVVEGLRPDYWYLENPQGRLRSVIGPPAATVTYCQYGEDYMKPTDLWGNHPPMEYRRCNRRESCHINHRDGSNVMRDDAGKRTAPEKSAVPYDLSEAILDAVEAAYAGETRSQAGIGDF